MEPCNHKTGQLEIDISLAIKIKCLLELLASNSMHLLGVTLLYLITSPPWHLRGLDLLRALATR